MLKNILNLEGAQQLSKNEQKSINGGVTKACADALAADSCVLLTTNCVGNGGTVVFSAACGRNICCQ